MSPLLSARWLAVLAAVLVVSAAPAANAQSIWTANCADAKSQLQKTIAAGGPAALTARRQLGLVAQATDDDSQIVSAWLPLFKTAPDSWAATAYWADFVDAALAMGNSAAISDAARAILANTNSAPFLRASARDALAQVAFDSGNNAAANKAWAALGYIRNWRIIGPYDNASRSGFDTAFAPEKQIAFDKPSTGLDGLTLHWFPLTKPTWDGTVYIGERLGESSPGVYYAVTSVDSPVAGPARLGFDTTGASKVFVNGQLVLRDPIRRNGRVLVSDPLTATIQLKKGANTILVKIAGEAKENVLFRLHCTDLSGEKPFVFAANPEAAQSDVPALSPASLAAAVPEPEAILRRQIAAQPGDIEAQLRLGTLLRDTGDFEAAVAADRQAVALAGESALAHWELSQSLAANDQTDEGRDERETTRKRDPRIIAAQIAFLDEQRDSMKPNDRVKAVKSLLATNANSTALLWALSDAYDSAQMSEDAGRCAMRAAALAPGEQSQIGLYTWLDGTNKPTQAEALLSATLRRFPNSPSLIDIQAQRQDAKGNFTGAAAALTQLTAGTEITPKTYLHLADVYSAAKKPALAAAALARARQEFPQSGDICVQLGDIEHQLKDDKAALRSYREAIRLDPTQVALRSKVQLLSGETPVSQLITLTDPAPLLAHLPRAKDNPGISAVRVLDEGYAIVYPDYAQSYFLHEIVTCLDTAAVKEFQRYPVAGYSGTATATIESARIIKPNGKIVDCMDKNEDDAADFPSLAPGDTIDLTYRAEDYPRGGLAGKFWTQWFFSGMESRISLSRYLLVTPKDMPIHLRAHGGLADPVVTNSGNWSIRDWKVTSQDNLRDEPMAAPLRDSGIWLDASTVDNWQDIIHWYQSLATPRCIPDAIVRAKADELTKDATTEDDKIRALVRFVADKIPYQSSPFRMSAYVPTEGKAVIGDSFGDCKDKSALLVAMLQHIGITAHMALLSGRGDGVTPFLPGPRFDHAITVIDRPSGPLWVDGTADSMEFGNLPFQDQGVPALVIADDKTDLTTTPILPVDKSNVSTTATAALDETGALTGSQRVDATGGMGWILRMVMQRVPESSMDQAVTGFFTTALPGARLGKTAMNGLGQVESPLEMTGDFTIPDFAQVTDQLIVAHVPWIGSGMGIRSRVIEGLRANTKPRESSLDVSAIRLHQDDHIALTLPTGWHVQGLTPEFKGDSPFGSYRFTYTVSGNTLTADRSVSYTPMTVDAKDLPAFLKFEETIDKLAKAPLLLQKN